MKELIFEFLQSPNRETYMALFDAISNSSSYRPYSDELGDVNQLMEWKKWEEALAAMRGAMPNLLLSPSAHVMTMRIAKEIGDHQASEIEGLLAGCCFDGILSTGDGTQAKPYLVLRTSDEYDILMFLGKELKQQSLVSSDDRHFDCMECNDGTMVWFDITTPYNKLADKFERRSERG